MTEAMKFYVEDNPTFFIICLEVVIKNFSIH